MNEATKPRTKKCPVCQKEYPEEDNYCGDDGSILEEARAPFSLGQISRGRMKVEL
jgi:predicted nucleic acid-binding Zn ribbon protein